MPGPLSDSSSQKFIARNRAPRVHIEYDVELYGARRTVQLPFVVGVLAELSGRAGTPRAPLAQRAFLDIDVDNFDERLRALRPRVAFAVPDRLGGSGAMLPVELHFERLDDFDPDAVAHRVPALARLLQARNALKELLGCMDGKAAAEALLAKALAQPALLQALAAPSEPDPGGTAERTPAAD